MSSRTVFRRACGLGMAAIFVAATAQAQPSDKRTYFTFSRPITLPGITLPAGKYMFRLADDQTTRKVIQVVSADGTKPYAMLLTIPDERRDAPKDAEVAFLETAARTPSAVKSWWYPGERIGYEFIYPKAQARTLAKSTGAAVLTTKTETTKADEARSAELARVDAAGREADIAAAKAADNIKQTGEVAQDAPQRIPPQVAAEPARTPPAASRQTEIPNPKPVARTRLPKTASNLPLVGMLGLLSLVAFGSLRIWRMER